MKTDQITKIGKRPEKNNRARSLLLFPRPTSCVTGQTTKRKKKYCTNRQTITRNPHSQWTCGHVLSVCKHAQLLPPHQLTSIQTGPFIHRQQIAPSFAAAGSSKELEPSGLQKQVSELTGLPSHKRSRMVTFCSERLTSPCQLSTSEGIIFEPSMPAARARKPLDASEYERIGTIGYRTTKCK